jgi:hypothetical protein
VPPSPTRTALPTATTIPTGTPNATATKQAQDDQATLQKYVDSGYVSSTTGTLYPLMSSTFNMAQQNFLNFLDAGATNLVTDFAAWSDVSWTSASVVNFPEFSGCGFAFRVQSNGDGYTAMLTSDSVLLTSCISGHCARIGKTKGSGRISLSDPPHAHFEFIVSKGLAYALVDGTFIGSYTLSQDKLIQPGNFLYSIVSGTNKDYGTRCTMDNGKLWVPSQ